MTVPVCPSLPLAHWLAPGTDSDIAAAYAELPARALEESFGLEDEIVFLDVETTGFDPARDHLVEVAAVLARGPEVLASYSTLVDPGIPVPSETTALTGIDDEAVDGAPSPEAAVTRLLEFADDRRVVAHNAGFDAAFVAAIAGGRLDGRWIDSLPISRVALPRLRSHRLCDLADAFGLARASHRAPDDAASLAAVWRVLLCGLSLLPREVLRAVAALAPPEKRWAVAEVVSQVAGSLPGKPSPLDLRALRAERVRASRADDLPDADEVPLRCPEAEQVLGEFGQEGLVGAMYDGFEPRSEQARMAEAVLDALREGRHAAIEAGTGVGKSVAYLVPAARFALDNGVALGVATKTNALLDQLVYGELPALARALAARGEDLRFVAVKGYDNYPCLRRLERAVLDGGDDGAPARGFERAEALAALLAWVAQTTAGDLDAINLHWRPEMRELIAARAAECDGKRCRFRKNGCFVHTARRAAASAHVVVTNHALLFRDLVSPHAVLPPIRHWIVDEAHAAEDEARGQLSLRAGHAELAALLLALGGTGRGGVLDAVSSGLGTLEGDPAPVREAVARSAESAGLARTLTASFFDFVKDLAPAQREYDRAEVRVTPAMREGAAWGTAAGVGRSLARRLGDLLDRGRVLVSALEEVSDDRLREARADLVGALTRLAEQRDALAEVLDGSDESYVYSLTADKRRAAGGDVVTAALLDVGEALAEQFYARLRSVIFTSATIATGDAALEAEPTAAVPDPAFAHFAARVGLDRLEPGAWDALRLRSSYDFERQMAVFVPVDLPEPVGANSAGHPEYMRRLVGLLERVHLALGGSTLTLFTNRREMDAAHAPVADALHREGLRLLLQGRGVSRKRLRDEFVADETVSLFATRSFWEGFDAPGDTLRCVVIPRLPFGQLGDPLLEERRERYHDWWEKWYLPQAILELKQAAGRLIRSSADEGCLVLADTRLAGPRPYARRFLDALPVRDVEMLTAEEVAESIERRFGRR